jgi:HD-like signal output (HDOD) protein
MLLAVTLVAALAVAMTAWASFRRRQAAVIAAAPAPAKASIEGVAKAEAAGPQILPDDTPSVAVANALATERLWRLAFAAPAQVQPLAPEHARVRDAVVAVLRADQLDPTHFPRRPTLMPQLLRAINDPDAAPDAAARIIARDPVLAGDVLRLANSNFYRVTPEPVETIQRAVVICGMDGLQSLLAAVLLQPVFRATDKNFPRFPQLLWERTERASRAAALYAAKARRQDRFEAQLVALLSALGPLVVYRATLAAYSQRPGLSPSAELCAALIGTFGRQMSQSIARHWQSAPRLIAALAPSQESAAADRSLAHALHCGELIGTLSLLESLQDIAPAERIRLAADAGLSDELTKGIWEKLVGTGN